MTVLLGLTLLATGYVLIGLALDELRESRRERPGRHAAKEVVL